MASIGFAGTLLFGAAAAMSLVCAVVGLGPWLPLRSIVAGHWVLAAAAYAALLAPTLRGRVGRCAAALAAGVACALLATRPAELAIGLAVIVAISRSGFGTRLAPSRALASELVLGLLGLVAARLLGGPGPGPAPGPMGLALALWAYALVQSCYFLIPAGRLRAGAARGGDAFDRARARLLLLLDDAH